ncbi:MAG: omptin family outer membrane protease [Kiritimatiellia bacterium]
MIRLIGVVLGIVCCSAVAVRATGTADAFAGNGSRLFLEVGLRQQQGKALELVYDGPFLLSELTWDIQDLLYAGGTLQWRVAPRWRLVCSYWEAVTEGNGGMEDYDYFLPGIWTDFSDGPVDINRAYTFDIRADWILWQHSARQLQLRAGYRQMYWGWSQYGGDFIYSEDGFRDFRGSFPVDQNGINYKQTFSIPYVGLGMEAHYERWQVAAYAHYSPVASAEALDEHVQRDLFFEDSFDNVKYYGLGFSVGYQLGDRWHVAGSWDWHDIPESRGDIRIIDAIDGTEESYDDSAGIANKAQSLSLSVGMRF